MRQALRLGLLREGDQLPTIKTGVAQLAINLIPPSWAQSSPTFVPERCEVWYSDGRTGFYNIRLTNGTCDILRGS